jgi:aryl carrier-like protein
MRKNTLSAVAVLLREDNPGAPRLVAYYVEPAGHAQAPAELTASITDDLPEYMIPTAWMKLERLPVSPNGKLDRSALPVPEVVVVNESEFLTPATPTEISIAKIWAEVLHLPRVGANMDLLKLGADSIQLFQIVARSSREGFRLTAKELLQLRTVRAVAASIDDAASRGTSEDPGGRKALPSLSQFQRGRRAAATTKR